MSQIQLENISKNFGENYVLNNINLEIKDGEFLVLVGPSGCGKSTLLRILAGLESSSSGSILLNNQNINDWDPRKRNFSLIFQNYALFPHMTVENNITFGMKMRGEHKSTFNEKVAHVAQLLQLQPLLKRKPKELSGGQRQRVAMARAIVRDPALFLMDEPLSNLDAKLRVEVREGIMKLHQTLKTSTVYVTHDQIEAMTMADRIVVLDKGRLQQIGTPEQLYLCPENLFVATFIGTPAMNILTLPCRDNLVMLNSQTIAIPKTTNAYQSSRIHLGIRPEHITETPVDKGQNYMTIDGKIINRELHGAEYLVQVDTEFGRLQYRKANQGEAPTLNSDIRLYLNQNKLYFFSTQTQHNLALEI
ncbi:ABC transporter ATP-binding protein [Orbus sasakiae]|uniref:ABC transporter ATP-binding protein n=1 Tax=Orbus sasakiae TaxID=1078475 RepID=A0ABP9N8Q7_9GAMM